MGTKKSTASEVHERLEQQREKDKVEEQPAVIVTKRVRVVEIMMGVARVVIVRKVVDEDSTY